MRIALARHLDLGSSERAKALAWCKSARVHSTILQRGFDMRTKAMADAALYYAMKRVHQAQCDAFLDACANQPKGGE